MRGEYIHTLIQSENMTSSAYCEISRDILNLRKW